MTRATLTRASAATFVALTLAALVAFTPLGYVLDDAYDGWSRFDLRAFGAQCDGVTDDAGSISLGYDVLNAFGGGRLYVPNGKTCRIASDVQIEAHVQLECDPGGTIEADSGGTFTNGMLSATSKTEWGVSGCNLDLNTTATSAVHATGSREIVLRDVNIHDGTTTATAQTYLHIACSGTAPYSCVEITDSIIDCSSGTADTGIYAAPVADTENLVTITGNVIDGCDAGSIVADGVANIGGNDIRQPSTGIGISTSGDYSSVSKNLVRINGDGIGYRNSGWFSSSAQNKAYPVSANSIGFVQRGAYSVSNGDTWRLWGRDTIGYKIDGASHIAISGCSGTVAGTVAGQTHIMGGGAQGQVLITGCVISKGAYGIVPQQGASQSDLTGGVFINNRVVGNIIYGTTDAAIVLTTGWHAIGNTINWGASTTVNIQIGSDETWGTGGSEHSVITGNHLHCAACASNIAISSVLKRCGTGNDLYKSCSVDGDCDGASTCDAVPDVSGIVITGNELMVGSSGVGVDFGDGAACSTSPGASNWTIDGNTFLLGSGKTAIGFCSTPSASQFHDIHIGHNSWDTSGAGTFLSGWSPEFGTKPLPRQACQIFKNVDGSSEAEMGPVMPDAVTVLGATCWCHDPDDGNCSGADLATFQYETREGASIGSVVTCNTNTAPGAQYTAFSTPYETSAYEVLFIDTVQAPTDEDEWYEICLQYE